MKTVIEAWDRIAQYVTPKLKAVEVSTADPFEDMTDEDIKKEYDKFLADHGYVQQFMQ